MNQNTCANSMPSVRQFTAKDQNRLKVKGLVKIAHANNQKKVRVAILISEKIDFKSFEKVIRDKEGHYIREKFANKAIDKRLISKIYKQLMQLNLKKKTGQGLPWQSSR